MGFWDSAKSAGKSAAVAASVAHNVATGQVSDASAHSHLAERAQSERMAAAETLTAGNNRSNSGNDRRK